jgi:hypothetical protein
MRFGENKIYSTKGIKIAMHYFTRNGHEVLSFLPEYLFRSKEESRRKDRITPDDPNYLKELMKKVINNFYKGIGCTNSTTRL